MTHRRTQSIGLSAVFLVLVALAGTATAQVEIWTSRYDSGAHGWNEARSVALTPEGDVVVTGFSEDADFDIATVKMGRDSGEVIWAERYDASPGAADQGVDVAVDDSGNVFVAGWTETYGPQSENLVAIKYAADGTELWANQYHSVLDERGMKVIPDGTGGCYVSGCGTNGGNLDYLVIHYDTDGLEDWVFFVDGPGSGNDYAQDMVMDDEGFLLVTGYADNGGSGNCYFTIKVDPVLGDTLWSATYDGSSPPTDDRAFGVAVDTAGNVYVCGRAGEVGTWYDATTVKYDADGDEVWVNRHDAGYNGSEDCASSIAVTPEGQVFCAGYTDEYFFESEFDFLVYSVNPDGSRGWEYAYDDALEWDSACAVTVDEFGNVYTTGYFENLEAEPQWWTLKHNNAGALIWMADHGVHDEWDIPNDLVLDDLGNVYVAGFDFIEGNEQYTTIKYSENDVGAAVVVAPADTLVKGMEVVPQVWVRNYSAIPQTFPVWIGIGNFYFDGQNVTDLAPFDSVLVSFVPWEVRDVGYYPVQCHTMLLGDKDPANDTTYGQVLGVYGPGWVEMVSLIPMQPSDEEVKRGAWLVYNPGDNHLYVAKGNKTSDFYRYDQAADTWSLLAPVPNGVYRERQRPPDKGTSGVGDGENYIYMTSGANTLTFWRYDIAANEWTQLVDVPEGDGRKRVKGGNDLEFVEIADTGYVYLLKGYKTEFYRYNVENHTWDTLPDAPGADIKGKYNRGSFLVYDNSNTIYCQPAQYYDRGLNEHFLYKYDVRGDTWYTQKLHGMPLYGLHGRKRRRKKSKDGAEAAWFDNAFYALKGGNTQQFFKYDVARDTWSELDTIPRISRNGNRKRVKYGGGIVYGNFAFWAMKGNRVNELWRSGLYLGESVFGSKPARSGVAALGGRTRLNLQVTPNPFVGKTAIRYSLPQSGRVKLSLFDVAGRCAKVAVDGWQVPGVHSVQLRDEGLAAGVYLAKLEVSNEAGTRTETSKLLLAR